MLRHSETPESNPKVRWIDDNAVSVDLGKIHWVSPRREQIGDIRVVHIHTLVDPPPAFVRSD